MYSHDGPVTVTSVLSLSCYQHALSEAVNLELQLGKLDSWVSQAAKTPACGGWWRLMLQFVVSVSPRQRVVT